MRAMSTTSARDAHRTMAPKVDRTGDGRKAFRVGSTGGGRFDALGGRSSSWDRDSLYDMVDQVSADRPAFQDSSRFRNLSVHEFPPSMSNNYGDLGSQERPHPKTHARKLLVIFLTLIVLVVLTLYYILRHAERELVTIEATAGVYRGFKTNFEGRTLFAFLGIPFGSNTSGLHRFRKPVSVGYTGVAALDATQQKLPCTQGSMTPPLQGVANTNGSSEDCLHLNLWTPSLPTSQQKQKTVLVFFYGVAFKWGSNGDYDGSALCALGDVIVVVPNYRLHTLGFLGDGSQDAPGNLALYDQIRALDWLHENIGAFGGDVSSIVPHGYEAGAVSIGYHMVSPVGNWVKTYSRFILQSGSLFRPIKRSTTPTDVMKTVGCAGGGWPCLRSLDESAFKTANVYKEFHFEPSIWSPYLPKDIVNLVSDWHFTKKQVLLGNVLDEGRFQIVQYKEEMRLLVDIIAEPLVICYVERELTAAKVRDFESLRRLYANGTVWESDAGNDIAKDILGDVFFRCPVLYLAEHISSNQSSAYLYLWTHKPSFGPWAQEDFGPMTYDDLAFIFGKPLLDGSAATREEQQLSRDTIALFSGFAKTGTLPNVGGIPWPEYSRVNPVTVEIQLQGLVVRRALHLAGHCDVLRSYMGRP